MAETGVIAASAAEDRSPNGSGGSSDAADQESGRSRGRLPVPTASMWFLVTTGIVVAIVVGVGVRAAADGWLPLGDNGFFALRAHDVLSRHPPLLGTASSASTFSSAPTNHPGPLQFVLLAVPVALLGVGAGTVLGTALMNAASIGGAVWLVRRRCGPTAGALLAVGFAGLGWAMGSVLLHEPWGPFAVVLPFGLFVVSVGLAAGGDAKSLLAMVIAGSVVLQTHVSYVLLVPGLGVVGFAGVLLWAWRDRRPAAVAPSAAVPPVDEPSPGDEGEGDKGDEGTTGGPGHVRRWILAALAAAVLCWTPPLYQQATGDPGNMSALIDAAQAEAPATITFQEAIYLLSGTVAMPPWWFPPGFEEVSPLYNDMDPDRAHTVADIATVSLVALLGLALWSAWRRRDRLALGALAAAIAGLGLGMESLLRAPAYGVWAASYTRFLWPLALWVWFSLGLTAARAWSARRARHLDEGRSSLLARTWWPRLGSVVLPATAVAAVVIGVFVVPFRDNVVTDRASWQRTGPPLVDAVLEAVEDVDGPVLVVDVISQSNYTFAPYVMAELADHDIEFLVANATLARQVGRPRAVSPGREPVAELWIMQYPDPLLGGETIFTASGLPGGLEEEMNDLTDQIEDDIRARGHLQISDEARDFVTKYIPDHVDDLEAAVAQDPLTPEGVVLANNYAFGRPLTWSDGTPLDRDMLERWAHLDQERVVSRVVVVLRPVPPPGSAPVVPPAAPASAASAPPPSTATSSSPPPSSPPSSLPSP